MSCLHDCEYCRTLKSYSDVEFHGGSLINPRFYFGINTIYKTPFTYRLRIDLWASGQTFGPA